MNPEQCVLYLYSNFDDLSWSYFLCAVVTCSERPCCVLATNKQVYGVNVLVTSGDGKVREQDLRTTVFKRNPNKNYKLKMKAARWVAASGQRLLSCASPFAVVDIFCC